MKKRFIVEFGSGADLHGADMTKAAARAIKDAVSHACLCGLVEILGRSSFEGILVHAEVRVPDPGKVDVEALKAMIPIGEKEIVVEKGGSGSELGAIAADILTYYFSASASLEAGQGENTLIR